MHDHRLCASLCPGAPPDLQQRPPAALAHVPPCAAGGHAVLSACVMPRSPSQFPSSGIFRCCGMPDLSGSFKGFWLHSALNSKPCQYMLSLWQDLLVNLGRNTGAPLRTLGTLLEAALQNAVPTGNDQVDVYAAAHRHCHCVVGQCLPVGHGRWHSRCIQRACARTPGHGACAGSCILIPIEPPAHVQAAARAILEGECLDSEASLELLAEANAMNVTASSTCGGMAAVTVDGVPVPIDP